MDKVVSKIVGLGVPGIILLVVISTSGVAGGAAMVSALALLGGPFGMLGGIALLGILVLIANALSEYGFEAIYKQVIKGLNDKGISQEEILKKIKSYPISKGLKLKLIEIIKSRGKSPETAV